MDRHEMLCDLFYCTDVSLCPPVISSGIALVWQPLLLQQLFFSLFFFQHNLSLVLFCCKSSTCFEDPLNIASILFSCPGIYDIQLLRLGTLQKMSQHPFSFYFHREISLLPKPSVALVYLALFGLFCWSSLHWKFHLIIFSWNCYFPTKYTFR